MTGLSRKSLRIALTLSAVTALAGCGGNTPVLETDHAISPVVLDEQAAAVAISRYRAQHGLGPVIVDPTLIRAASLQADSNARAGRLSHDLGGRFELRMKQAGLGRTHTAENLSAGSDTFAQVLARWQASAEHNRNMLIPQIRRIGIARADAPDTRFKRYWALVLAGD